MTDDRPHLLIVHTGNSYYREPLLRSVAPKYRVHLFTHAEPQWEPPYLDGWTVLSNTADGETVAAAARELHARQPVDGVLAWDESRVMAASHAAKALGLVGDPEYYGRCRDKHFTREALAVAGVPQPASVLVGSAEEALAAAEKLGYPVIVKPRHLAGSMGVIKVHSPAELAASWDFSNGMMHPLVPTFSSHVLVEEFVEGYEVSVDSAVHNGRVQPICVARKKIGYAPYPEEIGHSIDPADPLLSDEAFLDVVHGTHAALGFRDGFTHTEIMVTADGPKLIEVNARIGGDMIPSLALLSTGIDQAIVTADLALGREPDLTADRHRCSAIRFFYVEENNTRLDTIGFETDGAELPPQIDQMVTMLPPGTVTSPPPEGNIGGRIAYVTAAGDTVQECEAAIEAAGRVLKYTGEIVEAPAGGH